MPHALINEQTIVQVADAPFDVAEPAHWVSCPDDCQPYRWRYEGGQCLPPPPVPLPEQQAAALARVDADVDAIYTAVVGARAQEYEAAEREAQAFAAAGYEGQPGPLVASWASVKGWGAQQAASDILAQAAAWRAAMAAMRSQRLATKEAVRSAADAPELGTTLAAWAAFVAAMRQQLGA